MCLGAAIAVSVVMACGREADISDHVEMPDTMPILRAMQNAAARDSMLDSMPGGEMARGDSVAEMRLLKGKM